MISRFLFWALYPNMKTQKEQKFYINSIIWNYEDVASKIVEMQFKWQQTQMVHWYWSNCFLPYFFTMMFKTYDALCTNFVTFSVSYYDFENLKLWKTILSWKIVGKIFRTGFGLLFCERASQIFRIFQKNIWSVTYLTLLHKIP